jgi:23S rRNA (pseudouridine1915-N3)-methyltransferase
MDIRIITVGKPSRDVERIFLSDYLKRLRPVWPTEIVTVTADRLTRATNEGVVMQKEAERIRSKRPDGWPLVTLDRRGKAIDSLAFAERIRNWQDSGKRGIVFTVGGALGTDPQLLREADLSLSFGAMTYPHDLAAVLLTEQVYRAMTIVTGKPYHR